MESEVNSTAGAATADKFCNKLDEAIEAEKADASGKQEQEWTIEQVRGTLHAHGIKGIIRAHKSALDAAKVEAYSAGNTAAFESKYVRSLEAIAAAQRPLVDALHRLAMLSLQSRRYTDDPEYRDATDAALAQAKEGNQ